MNAAKRTGANPIEVSGVVFECWKTGIMQYAWISKDGKLRVYRPSHKTTYTAIVDGNVIGRRFQTERNAMRAAVSIIANNEISEQIRTDTGG